MKLETESGGARSEPNVSDLSEALRSLDTDGNTYAILSKSTNDFVQVLRVSQDDYRVEYHDPQTDDHFVASQMITLDQAQRLFADFRAGGSQWKTLAKFEQADLKSKSGCAGRGAAMILLIAIGGAFAIRYCVALV